MGRKLRKKSKKKESKRKNSVVQYLFWTLHLKTKRMDMNVEMQTRTIMILNAAMQMYKVSKSGRIFFYSFIFLYIHFLLTCM